MGLIVKDVHKRWPGGCIVFRKLDELHELSTAEIGLFQDAMAHWSQNADVRFLERTTQDSFVTFKPDADPADGISYSSSIGMQGDEQFIRLDPITTRDDRIRTSRHEVGHALGMYHEHQRRDREHDIDINEAEIKDLSCRLNIVNIISDQDGVKVGDYDLNSIMHYGTFKKCSKDGQTPIISLEHGDPLPSRSDSVSRGDRDSAAVLNGGNLHIYQLSYNGQIEKTVQQTNISAGMTSVYPYTLDVRQFLLFLRRPGGPSSLRAAHVNLDGTLGNRVSNEPMGQGWSSMATYGILGSTYAFLYRRRDGMVNIARLDGISGSTGASSDFAALRLERNWSSVTHYTIRLDNFLLFVNASTGEARVRKINGFDGQPHDVIQTRRVYMGWTTVQVFHVGSRHYLLMLKPSTGKVHVRKINDDGKIGEVVDTRHIAPGFKIGIPYTVLGGDFVFLFNPDTGRMEIRKLEGNGSLGAVTDARLFNPGWSTATVYTVGAGKYVILIKPAP
jgi:hypothetical protein